MAEHDPQDRGAFVERYAAVLVGAGVPRLPARLFGAVVCSESGALTAGELSEQLQVSAGGVSGAVRYLIQVGLLRREHVPGSRRDRYRLLDESWYQTMLARSPVVDQLIEVSAEGVLALGPDSRAARGLAESRDFLVFLRGELDAALQRWAERPRDEPGGR